METLNQVNELLQLLTVLGADIDPHPRLGRVSPGFLKSRLQQILVQALPPAISTSKGKLPVLTAKNTAEDLLNASFARFHSNSGSIVEPGHSHQHADGSMCSGDHTAQHVNTPMSHTHQHGDGPDSCESHESHHSHSEHDQPHAHIDRHDHDTFHGRHSDGNGGKAPLKVDSNQVIQLLRNYLSMIVQQIQYYWKQPPMFPGAPVRNVFLFTENSPPGKPIKSSHRENYNLLITVSGFANICNSDDSQDLDILLVNYTHDSSEARKTLFGLTEIELPREILHMLQQLLEYNSKKCPSIKVQGNVQQGSPAAGFKPSFLAPLEELLEDTTSGRFDLKLKDMDRLVDCVVCKCLGPELKCARCKQRVYCSVDCQLQDWKEHKKTCCK